MRVLDLFSGIGGFSLGLERAGMRTVAFCEVDPFCRAVLRKHWPAIPCYEDVRTLTAERLAADGIAADVICGGFPCQDISVAGKGAGIGGGRSGLWSQYARIIGELRPRYAIVENVAALLGRGLDRVLGDLSEIGYDAEWHCIPASAVGAPHRRDRLWIVAYPERDKLRDESRRRDGARGSGATKPRHDGAARLVADAVRSEWREVDRARRSVQRPDSVLEGEESPSRSEPSGEAVANTPLNGRHAWRSSDRAQEPGGRQPHRSGFGTNGLAHSNQPRLEIRIEGPSGELPPTLGGGWWLVEPDVGRVAHGVPSRVDRLRSLGNAVVPQIPEIIGRAIMSVHSHTNDR